MEVVFALGGDGTAREAAAGLLGSGVALGILPGGTTNVLARMLTLPLDPVEAAGEMGRTERARMDVGMCGPVPFLMQTSAGLDALVLDRMDPAMKRLLGKSAYVLQGLGEWLSYDYPRIEIEADGRRESATFVAVCNIAQYGGPMKMVPSASAADGRLDLLLFRGTGRADTMAFAVEFGLGAHVHRRDVEIRSVESVTFLGPRNGLAQIDGDVSPERFPFTVRLAAERLMVLAPRGARF